MYRSNLSPLWPRHNRNCRLVNKAHSEWTNYKKSCKSILQKLGRASATFKCLKLRRVDNVDDDVLTAPTNDQKNAAWRAVGRFRRLKNRREWCKYYQHPSAEPHSFYTRLRGAVEPSPLSTSTQLLHILCGLWSGWRSSNNRQFTGHKSIGSLWRNAAANKSCGVTKWWAGVCASQIYHHYESSLCKIVFSDWMPKCVRVGQLFPVAVCNSDLRFA